MKRFHVHLAVANLEDSIRFYSALFDDEPSVVKADYAKWMLDDPRVNFAISQRGAEPGLDHLGFQVDSDEELVALNQRLADAELPSREEFDTACCYVQSNKYWSVDPQGIPWEGFHSLQDIPTFNGSVEADSGTTCCAPRNDQTKTPSGRGCC